MANRNYIESHELIGYLIQSGYGSILKMEVNDELAVITNDGVVLVTRRKDTKKGMTLEVNRVRTIELDTSVRFLSDRVVKFPGKNKIVAAY